MFVGREREIEILQQGNWRDQAQLIVIYGRRRVGKTALVEEAFKKEEVWKFEGIESADEAVQISMFAQRLHEVAACSVDKISDWNSVFLALAKAINGKKVIVFFDEFQWLACMDEKLVSLFKYYWDNYFLKQKNCRFVICGSVSSFIVKKVLQSKSLYGRVNTEIQLQPMSLAEVREFLPQAHPQDVLEYAMTLGGIPKYLLELQPQKSYVQNIDEQAFHPQGYFFEEFGRLFISHFSKNILYQKVIAALGDGSKTAEDLAKKCGVLTGGTFSEILNNLALAGFVEKYQPVDKPLTSKLLRYRLLDEYLHFYFDFIAPNIPAIIKNEYHFSSIARTRLQQWQGYAFERLCRKHSGALADRLRFSAVSYTSGSWFQAATNTSKKGAQIDLMFIRKDRVITVCEIKYTNKIMASELIASFKNKLEILERNFSNYGMQKVLILGKKVAVPNSVQQFFDRILFAEDFLV